MSNASPNKETITTENVEVDLRMQYWRDLVCDTFVEMSCESAREADFFGKIQTQSRGNMQYSEVTSSGQHLVRDRVRIDKSSADNFLLSVQLEGECKVTQNGRVGHLKPGYLALYDVTRPYELLFEDRFCQLIVHIPRDKIITRFFGIEKMTALSISGSQGIGRLASSLFIELASQIRNLSKQDFDSVNSHALDLLSSALSDRVGRQKKSHSNSSDIVVRRAIDFVERSLRQDNLSVAVTAEAVGVSARYLRKQFQDKDFLLSEWIWLRRLENARIDLLDPLKSDVSVMSIAFSWGFKDPAHFSRAFKKRFGCSPSEQRMLCVA